MVPLVFNETVSQEISLKLSSVTKSFGDVSVLRGVDLELKSGERVALMGPSGSGNRPCSIAYVESRRLIRARLNIGRLLGDLNGNELEQLRRESIGYVFQSFHLLPTLTAFENVEFPAQLIGMEKEERLEKVQRLIDSVGLAERSNHLPDALSGGERQRVAIARALIHRPALLLADEPTGSLDTENGDQVLNLLKTLSIEHGVAVLLVTHDQASTAICDRVISMRDGTLVS